MGESPRNYSKSANRALDVLTYLAGVGAPARAAEIADALGMARSSADQLLKTMVSGGYLVLSAEDKTYFPSLRLVRVGRWMAECYPAEARLSALVEDLHGRTGDIVTVTIETDCFMQVMAWAQAGAPDPHLSHGYRVPVIGSAIGGAALTTKSKDEIRKIASRARRQRAMMDDMGSLSRLMDRVNLCRATGYSARRTMRQVGETTPPLDYWSIGVSLPQHSNGASVVLGFSGPTEKVRPREGQIVGLMRETIGRHLAA